MATKKDTKKEKKYVAQNPYAFFTKNRSKKAIEMDYSMQAKPPSPEEHRVNRSDWQGENFVYLQFFKKHNMPIPKKSGNNPNNLIPKSGSSGTTTKKTTKSSGTKKKTTKKSSAKKTTAKKTTAKKTTAKKTTAKKTTAKKTTSKKKISEPQITEKTTQKKVKEPKKTTTKKVVEKKEPVKKPATKKKVNKTPEPEKEQKKYRNYYYVDVVYFTPEQFEKLEFLYETTLPNKKDKAYCYMSADENSDEYNFYLFFNKNKQEAYQISSVQMLNFNDPSDKERKERADRFTDIAAKLYKEKNKIETSETTKKVSKKTSTKKSTAKISNPKDYPTLMAMRVKEKIIKDHNRCDFTKEEIEEAVDLSIRRGNETQGQIVKDAINILFATSKGH